MPFVLNPDSGSGVQQVFVGTAPSETTHDFQGGINFGIRF
jgi:hypothetical protein